VEASDCRDRDSAHGDDAGRRPVREVMLTRPKTLPAAATVADLRRLFTNPRVETALLVEQSHFAGVVDRERLEDAQPDDLPAAALANRDRVTIGADATVAEAMARMDENGSRRLVVVGDDGATVRGLLCLNTRRTGFCG
jgi:CBS domain-containing protein